jgi:DNA polymerase-3 subunit alpha
MANYEKILETELSNKNLINSGQIFFDFMLENDDFQYTPVSESKLSRLKLEKEVLGRYVTGHPLEDHEEEFKKFNFNTTMLTPIENEDAEPEFDDNGNEIIHYKYDVTDGQRISFGGILSDVTVKISKSNKKWGFATIEDYYGSAEITFFGNTYTRYKDLLVDDSFVKINGRISISDDRPTPKIEVQNIYRWGLADKEITEDSRVLCIKIDNDEDEYRKVSELLQDNIDPHGAKVKIQVGDKLFCLDYRVMDADGLKSRLIGIVGYNNVKILS